MIRHVLDTDIFTLLNEGDPIVRTQVLARPASEVAISVITVEE